MKNATTITIKKTTRARLEEYKKAYTKPLSFDKMLNDVWDYLDRENIVGE